MRWAVNALIAIAAVQVTAALIVLAWSWEDYFSEHRDVSVHFAIMLVELVASACLLLFGGGRRAADAGPGLVLPAQGHDSVASHPPRLPWDVPLQQLVPDYLLEGSRLSGCLLVPAHVFAPAFLWVFAAEWPRVPRRNRLDDLARRMVPVSVAIGRAIWITCVVAVELARAGYGETRLGLVLDVSLAILSLLMFGAAVVVPLSARSAPAGEAKRTVLFSVGFVVFLGVWAVYNIGEAFSSGS